LLGYLGVSRGPQRAAQRTTTAEFGAAFAGGGLPSGAHPGPAGRSGLAGDDRGPTRKGPSSRSRCFPAVPAPARGPGSSALPWRWPRSKAVLDYHLNACRRGCFASQPAAGCSGAGDTPGRLERVPGATLVALGIDPGRPRPAEPPGGGLKRGSGRLSPTSRARKKLRPAKLAAAGADHWSRDAGRSPSTAASGEKRRSKSCLTGVQKMLSWSADAAVVTGPDGRSTV